MNTAEETAIRVDCGDWRLVREIGRGAYGVVYVAENDKGERAAVKVCRRDDIGEECYARELRGAKLYRSIPPQYELVHMRELVEKPWGFYTVMDLADDEFGEESSEVASYRPKTLAKVIDGEKALPLNECVTLGISLAKGLVTLQRHHLLHRDIKPGNVIYIKGRPVLSDPGLVVEGSEAVSQVGTPSYTPPEGFTNDTGDIYSLGLTLKAASFGRRIEDLNKGPAIEADTGAKFFPAWWHILNKATDENPRQRYQSAKAMLKDLESLRRKIALAPIVGSRVAKVMVALSVLALIVIAAFFIVSNEHAKEDLARRTSEIKSLKEGLAQHSAEIKPLQENLARQSAENKSLKEDLNRRSSENKALTDNIVRQSAEIQSLKEDLARQTAEIAPLKEGLARQSKENKSLRDALDRQSEQNKALRDDFVKRSEEIKALKDDISSHPVESAALTDKEVESLKDLKYQIQLAKYIKESKDYLEKGANAAIYTHRVLHRLESDMMKQYTTGTNDEIEKTKLADGLRKLSEVREEVKSIMIELFKKQAALNEAINTVDGNTRQTVEKIVLAAQKNLKEGGILEKRAIEIGKLIYGREWEHAPEVNKSTFPLTPEETSIMLESTSGINLRGVAK